MYAYKEKEEDYSLYTTFIIHVKTATFFGRTYVGTWLDTEP